MDFSNGCHIPLIVAPVDHTLFLLLQESYLGCKTSICFFVSGETGLVSFDLRIRLFQDSCSFSLDIYPESWNLQIVLGRRSCGSDPCTQMNGSP